MIMNRNILKNQATRIWDSGQIFFHDALFSTEHCMALPLYIAGRHIGIYNIAYQNRRISASLRQTDNRGTPFRSRFSEGAAFDMQKWPVSCSAQDASHFAFYFYIHPTGGRIYHGQPNTFSIIHRKTPETPSFLPFFPLRAYGAFPPPRSHRRVPANFPKPFPAL